MSALTLSAADRERVQRRVRMLLDHVLSRRTWRAAAATTAEYCASVLHWTNPHALDDVIREYEAARAEAEADVREVFTLHKELCAAERDLSGAVV